MAGRNVINGLQGNVIIPSKAKVTYASNYDVVLDDGFEVQDDGEFSIERQDSPCY